MVWHINMSKFDASVIVILYLSPHPSILLLVTNSFTFNCTIRLVLWAERLCPLYIKRLQKVRCSTISGQCWFDAVLETRLLIIEHILQEWREQRCSFSKRWLFEDQQKLFGEESVKLTTISAQLISLWTRNFALKHCNWLRCTVLKRKNKWWCKGFQIEDCLDIKQIFRNNNI